jgi:hypothetical protein
MGFGTNKDNSESPSLIYQSLHRLRMASFESLYDDNVFGFVDRDNIFQSMLKFYSSKEAHKFKN